MPRDIFDPAITDHTPFNNPTAPAPTAPAGLLAHLAILPHFTCIGGSMQQSDSGRWIEDGPVLRAAIASPSEEPGLDVNRLRIAMHNIGACHHGIDPAPRMRWPEMIAGEYARLREQRP
jgi:hypothetical protein